MMTTPERLRRRQLIEGTLLILIGLVMIWQIWYFNSQDREQRECVADKFQELTIALDKRGDLIERESYLNERVNLAELRAKSSDEFVRMLKDYQTDIDLIREERRENPVPPFPIGVCDQ